MKSARACVVGLVLLAAGGAAALGQDKPEAAAQKAAEKWLTLIDAREYGQSWDEAAAAFKGAITKEAWGQAVKNVHDQTGKLKSRKLARAEYTKNLPNAPEGEYVVIQYDASFEKLSAVETITPMREKDGSWKVSGYHVKPKE